MLTTLTVPLTGGTSDFDTKPPEALNGWRSASLYSAPYCTAENVGYYYNFGCGGTCYQISGARSILLYQESAGNPVPTADLFSDTNCKNKVTHAGIWKGNVAGCSSWDTTAQSVYLYWNC